MLSRDKWVASLKASQRDSKNQSMSEECGHFPTKIIYLEDEALTISRNLTAKANIVNGKFQIQYPRG